MGNTVVIYAKSESSLVFLFPAVYLMMFMLNMTEVANTEASVCLMIPVSQKLRMQTHQNTQFTTVFPLLDLYDVTERGPVWSC